MATSTLLRRAATARFRGCLSSVTAPLLSFQTAGISAGHGSATPVLAATAQQTAASSKFHCSASGPITQQPHHVGDDVPSLLVSKMSKLDLHNPSSNFAQHQRRSFSKKEPPKYTQAELIAMEEAIEADLEISPSDLDDDDGGPVVGGGGGSNLPPDLVAPRDPTNPIHSYTEDFSQMDNDALSNPATIPGWDLIHSPPRKLPRGALVGRVVSDKMQKTVNVAVDRYKMIPKLRVRRRYTRKFMAHDEEELCRMGDLVMIVPCQRLSRHKHFMVREIIRAKGVL